MIEMYNSTAVEMIHECPEFDLFYVPDQGVFVFIYHTRGVTMYYTVEEMGHYMNILGTNLTAIVGHLKDWEAKKKDSSETPDPDNKKKDPNSNLN